MTGWIVCAACGLRHSARADGKCPRCEGSAGPGDAPGGTPRPDGASRPEVVAPAGTSGENARNRAAAAAFLLLGAFELIAVLTASGAKSPVLAGATITGLVDLALGSLLAWWPGTARLPAMVRSAIGLAATLALPFFYPSGGRGLELVFLMRLPFFLGMLILLPGRASTGRTWFGMVAAIGPYVFFKLVLSLQPAAETGVFRFSEFVLAFLRAG